LKEEVSHVEHEFRRESLDDAEINNLKLPLQKGVRTIENPQELSEYQNLVTNIWNRTGLEFTPVLEKLRSLSVNWLNLRAGHVQLSGPTGIIMLTPEVLAGMQDQAKVAINRFRLHIAVLESLLRVVLQERQS
jgi:hypothetical protein